MCVCPQGGSGPEGGAWSGEVPGAGGCLVRGVWFGGDGPGGCLVWEGVWSRGVPGGDTPRDGYCCRRYASYWNAFLFLSCNDVAAFMNEVSLLISTAVLILSFNVLTYESSFDSFFHSFLKVSTGSLDAYCASCGLCICMDGGNQMQCWEVLQ